MSYRVEVWQISMPDDEEPCETAMVWSGEFAGRVAAEAWAWKRMEEGFFVRMYRV